MDLDQLPHTRYIRLHRFIPSQQGDLVKIHLTVWEECQIVGQHFLKWKKANSHSHIIQAAQFSQ